MAKSFSLYRSSAGSGKTRTLAKEWLKLALGYRADYFRHILAVTFTNKASQEMKDRILQYLDDFANGRNPSLAEELQRELKMDPQTFQQRSQDTRSTLLHQYDNFSISTIDAFFQKVIRSFTREAGLVGDYRLEVDQDAILEEVVDNLIDELGTNPQLTEWVVDFAKENLENERSWDVRYSLVEFASEIFREEFKAIEEEVRDATSAPGFFRQLRERLWATRNAFLVSVSRPAREILELIESRRWDPSEFSYGKNSGLFSFLDRAARAKSISSIPSPGVRIREHFTDGANWPNKKSRNARDISAVATSELAPRLVRILDCCDRDLQRALSAEVALRNLYVFGLITDIARKLKEYKDENNVMLLADAPKFLNGVIRDSDTPFIYEKVGSFYKHYLIDEFQDTSGLQWQNFQPLIINSLDQGYHSLVVGDVKQAIYRWRGGDLSLLQEKISTIIGLERTAVHELVNNFRSASTIVEFNNRVFKAASTLVSIDTGVPSPRLAYEDVAQQVSKSEPGFAEITFLSDEITGDESGEVVSWKWKAMENIPKVLERLQDHGASLKDIAILVRKNDEGQQIASYLLQYRNSPDARPDCSYDVVSNESLRIDGAAPVNLLLAALRYLLNTDDAIARAQLSFEYSRVHEPERELYDVFAVSNQSTFENNLPAAFTRQKAFLKRLPLVELTETLIEIFGLGKLTGELVYIQAFQDLVLEFSSREKNDLGAFLEWWEMNKHKKSIQISGEVNAVQILTVHKSKGLQFRYVIIPFCSWSLDHDRWQAPNLWVKSDDRLFADAAYLPVKYGKTLENTLFAESYAEERARVYLDNLNLLYVALTRAEHGLVVTAPSPESRGSKGTIAGLLYQSIQADDELRSKWDDGIQAWSSGSWDQDSNNVDDEVISSIELSEYRSSSWRDKLIIRRSGFEWFGEETREKVDYGIYMHAVLSRMHFGDEMDDMLTQISNEGLISEEERAPLRKSLMELLENARIADWFSREWEVHTEVPILSPEGAENRIDRLLTKGKKAIVIDFKTGVRNRADEKQVFEYMTILRKMNFTEVEGYILYLSENAVAEVKPGKSRLVQKRTKNVGQLDLGL